MDVDVNIRVSGGAGQGVHTVGGLLSRLAVVSGYHFIATQDYMSRIRGGRNSYTVRIGSSPVRAGRGEDDVLLALNPGHLPYFLPRLSARGFAVADGPGVSSSVLSAPLKGMAVTAGSPILGNVAGLGIIAEALGFLPDALERLLAAEFKGEFLEKNVTAARLGAEWARVHAPGTMRMSPRPSRPRILLSGNEALALGALAGGCKFAAGYPMTPGTGILQGLLVDGPPLGLVFEQAEDEIAAINMAIGASYAGARSMVATSGGGFALMAEGLSLAGILETPLVIGLAMRPGPATGMPTRTAQEDLDFVIHAGHGEFPRAVFAPGSPEEAFELAQLAFDTAERFQAPVFLLTDQYLADMSLDLDPETMMIRPVKRHVVRGPDVPRNPEGKYLRYAITENGVSPMAIPGEPGVTVVVDSDEHSEDGHLTEDHAIRVRMVEKRLRKGREIARHVLPPLYSGKATGDLLLVGFGSTKEVVAEAREILEKEGFSVGAAHLRQVWPLPARELEGHASGFRRIVTVENNATGQLAGILRRETEMHVDGTIRRFDGLPLLPADVAKEAREGAWKTGSKRA
ncbi:MAG: 2-oxoacid:acceptor oxidoreductase subunit alpha [Deltaproteobacteria bacterium]|nr:2-oxoacid:acceptor oxidoreductase subunit alpha [Deltaproteobacteria bacterium]